MWTSKQLTEETREFLSSLSPQAAREGFQLFHGSPIDPVWDYVIDQYSAADALARTEAPVVLVGHSHVPTAISLADGALTGGVATADFSAVLGTSRWLFNPGSVGQPRDGDPRAAFLRLDRVSGQARFERVAYPVARTQEEIRERGLPDSLAERLAHGL